MFAKMFSGAQGAPTATDQQAGDLLYAKAQIRKLL